MIDGFEDKRSRTGMSGKYLDRLVDFIKAFREELGTLEKMYRQMPALIDAEHDAIRSGNFTMVREATAAKMDVCDRITETHEILVGQSRSLPELAASLTGVRCDPPATLSECLATLVDLADHATAPGASSIENSLTRDMLQKLLAGSTDSLESFLQTASSVKSRIEANRVVLEKMLTNYQDSYRFWMEMATEAQSSYDAKGVQRSSGVASGLRVKA